LRKDEWRETWVGNLRNKLERTGEGFVLFQRAMVHRAKKGCGEQGVETFVRVEYGDESVLGF
jgi:hypothetical protein